MFSGSSSELPWPGRGPGGLSSTRELMPPTAAHRGPVRPGMGSSVYQKGPLEVRGVSEDQVDQVKYLRLMPLTAALRRSSPVMGSFVSRGSRECLRSSSAWARARCTTGATNCPSPRNWTAMSLTPEALRESDGRVQSVLSTAISAAG